MFISEEPVEHDVAGAGQRADAALHSAGGQPPHGYDQHFFSSFFGPRSIFWVFFTAFFYRITRKTNYIVKLPPGSFVIPYIGVGLKFVLTFALPSVHINLHTVQKVDGGKGKMVGEQRCPIKDHYILVHFFE